MADFQQIEKYSTILADKVDFTILAEALVNKGLISRHQVEEYLHLHNIGKCVYQMLLLELIEQGLSTLKRFVNILRKLDYKEVSDLMEGDYALTNISLARKGIGGIKISNTGFAFGSDGNVCCRYIDEDSPTLIENEDQGPAEFSEFSFLRYDQDIVVRKAENFYSSESKRIYQMESKPKGYALVIVNKDFENNVYESRLGAEQDLRNLIDLFTGLGYKVFDHQNKTRQEILDIVEAFTSNLPHENVDSCVVAISTHGEAYRIVSIDNEYIWVEDLLDYFNTRNCPQLLNKPKLFFIQACRGNEVDYGAVGTNHLDVYDSKNLTGASNATPSLLQPIQRSSLWTDMLIAYSTIPGYVSLRNPSHGSWFIQAVARVFMEHSHNSPISQLFPMVAELMEGLTSEARKQAPEIVHRGWKKDLYFNPGLYKNP